jgi:hypothetical protein
MGLSPFGSSFIMSLARLRWEEIELIMSNLKDHMPVLHHVEKAAQNGSLSKEVGYPISGWQVTNTMFQEAPHRRRRALRATATPVVTRGPPTRICYIVLILRL